MAFSPTNRLFFESDAGEPTPAVQSPRPARDTEAPGPHVRRGEPPRRLSCGIVLLNLERELLLCHVTGHNHWDLPKGGMDAGETPQQTALRETREETGLALGADGLHDLGRMPYTGKKDLHLFAALVPRLDVSRLHCESQFSDRMTGQRLPEMDGYRWVEFSRAGAMCTPKMALVIARLDLASLLERLEPLGPLRQLSSS